MSKRNRNAVIALVISLIVLAFILILWTNYQSAVSQDYDDMIATASAICRTDC